MSILAPSRAELLPVHDPVFGPREPAAMPPHPAPPHPAPAAPNHAASAKPFSLASSFEMARLEQATMESEARQRTLAWQKSLDVASSKSAAPRVALSSVNTNTNTPTTTTTNTTTTAAKVTSRLSASFSTSHSIPKPAAVPDVFAASDSDKTARHTRVLATTASATGPLAGKRSRGDPLPSLASKRARIDREAHEAAKRDYKVEEQAWRAKWLKMFPTLLFHFEMGTQHGSGKQLVQRVVKMGAKVDQFFSTRITHLIVKNAGSPQKPKAVMGPPSRKANMRESPMSNPFLDNTGTTDLVQKAQKLGIKVWTVDKLANMLSRLAPPVETVVDDSLRTLLEDERIHGTRERDLSAPRPDWYYFKPGSKYLLIEDATGKHRPVMMKEYGYTQKDKDTPEWPTLYDKFLRPSSANQSSFPVDKIRQRAWTLYVEQKPYRGELPPESDEQQTSPVVQIQPDTPTLPEALPYQNASGNSVVLTSNIASTSTARDSPAAFGWNGVFKDRAMMNMNKRVQVLKGNARNMAAKRSMDSAAAEPKPAVATTAAFPAKTFLPRYQLAWLLKQAKLPNRDPPPCYDVRVKNREKVDAGLKGREQDTASGYCENCRLRYSDLSVHIASRKHRRFATNPEHFASLDRLLQLLTRAPNPKLASPDYPVCDTDHGGNDTCRMCEIWQNESGSETESPCSRSHSSLQTRSQSQSEMSEADDTEHLDEDEYLEQEQEQEQVGQENNEDRFEEIYDEEDLY